MMTTTGPINPPLYVSDPPLPVGKMLERSWNVIKNQLAISAALALVLVMGLGSTQWMPWIGWLVNAVVATGYIACLYKIRRNEDFDFADFFWAVQKMNRFLNVVLASVATGAIIIVGIILLIIPGIYLSIALSLGTILLVQTDTDAISSIKASYNLVKGNWWRTLWVLIVAVGLNILGILCLGIGVLISIPVSYLLLIEYTEDLQRTQGAPAGPPVQEPTSTFQVNPS